jgi:hypothetical protein
MNDARGVETPPNSVRSGIFEIPRRKNIVTSPVRGGISLGAVRRQKAKKHRT